ncbi:MAG: FHA domain-containing protein [Planctomycetia bacterium]|nr:FHA domain-containing protein [Planctomycetia bacterium]
MSAYTVMGELIPTGGGDPIPLIRERMVIGRREGCDIVLAFPNVSGKHCELYLDSGYWFIRDLNSSNGIRVSGKRVKEKRVDPGSLVSIAKHEYTLSYSPADNGAMGTPPPDVEEEPLMARGLLERAGLERRKVLEDADRIDRENRTRTSRRSGEVRRYELLDENDEPENWRDTPL